MAKKNKSSESVYKIVEVIGRSSVSDRVCTTEGVPQ